MKPKDIIAQLFGEKATVNDIIGASVLVDEPTYAGATFASVDFNMEQGTATFYDQAGRESLKLAVKAELVPIKD